MASFFFQGLGTGACGENVSPPTKRLKKGQQNGHAFPQEEAMLFGFFFLNELVAGTPRHTVKRFAQIFQDLTA